MGRTGSRAAYFASCATAHLVRAAEVAITAAFSSAARLSGCAGCSATAAYGPCFIASIATAGFGCLRATFLEVIHTVIGQLAAAAGSIVAAVTRVSVWTAVKGGTVHKLAQPKKLWAGTSEH